MTLRIPLAALAVLAILPLSASAQDWKVVEDDEWCDRNRSADWCEVRELTFDPGDEAIRVDSGGNGGIRVEGWDRDDVQVRVRVTVSRADDEEEARELADAVEILTKGRIEPRGPRTRGRGPHWSVSFRLMVPRESDLDLESNNGGISVEDVTGELDLKTDNGGLSLEDVSGEVRARTTNGGIVAMFRKDAQIGEGITLSTTNGGIELELPEGIDGDLRASTVNGAIRSDFEADRTDRRRRPSRIRATLGEGGPEIDLETVNGGIRIRER